MFEIVAERIDSIFKANPDKNIISLSQNDGNYPNCTCDDCKAIEEFMKALEGLSAISDNIFIWDYGINFDNFIAPFPNFHILQDYIRLFKKH